jgi:hypothetical protein
MADLGSAEADINGFPANLRTVLKRILTPLFKDLRFGHPRGEQPDPLQNFGGGFFHAVTPADVDTEFTIQHGFGRVPYLAIPCLMLDAPGVELPPLRVTRAADDRRIYLSSSVAGATFSLIVEG